MSCSSPSEGDYSWSFSEHKLTADGPSAIPDAGIMGIKLGLGFYLSKFLG